MKKVNVRNAALSFVLSIAVVIAPYVPVAIVTPVAMTQAGCSAAWIQTALNDLPILVQIAQSILGIVSAAQGKGQIDPAMATQVQTITGQVKDSLVLLQNLVNSYQSASASARSGILSQIDSALTAVQGNLNAIMSAFHINNPALQATISTAVGLSLSVLLAIQSLVPPPPSPTPVAMAVRRTPVKPMSPKQVKAAFNQCLTVNGFPEFAIQ